MKVSIGISIKPLFIVRTYLITVRVDLSSDILLSLSSEEKNPYGPIDFHVHLQLFFSLLLLLLLKISYSDDGIYRKACIFASSSCQWMWRPSPADSEKERKKTLPQGIFFSESILFSLAARSRSIVVEYIWSAWQWKARKLRDGQQGCRLGFNYGRIVKNGPTLLNKAATVHQPNPGRMELKYIHRNTEKKKRRASTALKSVRDSSADTIESSSSTSTRGDCLKGWTKGDTIMSQYVFQPFGFFCTALSFLCPWSVQLRKFIKQIKIQPCMSHENAQIKLWPDVTWNMFPEWLFGRSRYWIPTKHAGGTKEEEKPAVRGKIMVGARLSFSFLLFHVLSGRIDRQ